MRAPPSPLPASSYAISSRAKVCVYLDELEDLCDRYEKLEAAFDATCNLWASYARTLRAYRDRYGWLWADDLGNKANVIGNSPFPDELKDQFQPIRPRLTRKNTGKR